MNSYGESTRTATLTIRTFCGVMSTVVRAPYKWAAKILPTSPARVPFRSISYCACTPRSSDQLAPAGVSYGPSSQPILAIVTLSSAPALSFGSGTRPACGPVASAVGSTAGAPPAVLGLVLPGLVLPLLLPVFLEQF